MNPVLAREMRTRLRGVGPTFVITAYLTLLATILWFIYRSYANRSVDGFGFDTVELSRVGRVSYHALLFTIILLLAFIVPGAAGGAIAGERERQTLVSLQVTPLGARSIVIGKILASFAFLGLLIVVTLPLMSVSFLLGGVTLGEMVRGVAMAIVFGITLSCLCVALSTLARRVQVATVLGYFLSLFLVLGTLLLFWAQALLSDRSTDELSPALLILNPFVATAGVVTDPADDFFDSPSVFSPFRQLAGDDERDRTPPLWVWSVAADAMLCGGSVVVASRRIRTPSMNLRT